MREGYRSNRVIQSPNTGCDSRNEQWTLHVFGSPTGGDFDLSVTVNGVTEDVTIGCNDSSALTETALKGHSEIGASDVSVSGGTLPDSSQTIDFQGDLASKFVELATSDHSGLTGGTGVGVLLVRSRGGYPGNA